MFCQSRSYWNIFWVALAFIATFYLGSTDSSLASNWPTTDGGQLLKVSVGRLPGSSDIVVRLTNPTDKKITLNWEMYHDPISCSFRFTVITLKGAPISESNAGKAFTTPRPYTFGVLLNPGAFLIEPHTSHTFSINLCKVYPLKPNVVYLVKVKFCCNLNTGETTSESNICKLQFTSASADPYLTTKEKEDEPWDLPDIQETPYANTQQKKNE